MTAQIDLEDGSKPAELEAVVERADEGGFRQIHLRGDVLHPVGVSFVLQQADRRGVTRERAIREGVDLKNANPLHLEPSSLWMQTAVDTYTGLDRHASSS
jgi:hypothetical protein